MPITPANLAASVVTPSRSKRRREEDLDQEPEWQEFSSDEEREFFALADSAVKPTNGSAGPLDPLSSPAVARTLTVDGLSTPVTNQKMAAPPPVPVPGPVPGSLAAKRQRIQPSPYAASSSRLQSAPHLNRGQDPAAPGDQDILGPEEAEITGIMALLKTHNSPPAVCNAVRSTFDRFAMRIASARTEKRLAQAAVEDRDERIARLQAKLRDLENSVREQREARASTRGLLLEMYQNI
ncbi:unnamed protein product [Parascedosporium putredinis]|uniref:Uncharacterized protein n=1 Tax=Parascedosporium putredinis TaxID=1442378 RepID=A0A9P1H6P9_9PEZI|nr:unnamed protein product [Parascedosporium putredinis]CAI7999022.1 unnamed protein product [Parascedosporium putredinis]